MIGKTIRFIGFAPCRVVPTPPFPVEAQRAYILDGRGLTTIHGTPSMIASFAHGTPSMIASFAFLSGPEVRSPLTDASARPNLFPKRQSAL
jgi:hypothetical protein